MYSKRKFFTTVAITIIITAFLSGMASLYFFSVTKDVLYLKCGDTYTGIFTYWGDIPFTAHLDNGTISFDWNNNKNDLIMQ